MSSVLWRWLHRRELLQTLWILSTAKRLINFANARCRWQRWRHKSRSGRTNCPQSAQQCRLWLIHRERERESSVCQYLHLFALAAHQSHQKGADLLLPPIIEISPCEEEKLSRKGSAGRAFIAAQSSLNRWPFAFNDLSIMYFPLVSLLS